MRGWGITERIQQWSAVTLGMSSDEARRAAVVRFGGRERWKDALRLSSAIITIPISLNH